MRFIRIAKISASSLEFSFFKVFNSQETVPLFVAANSPGVFFISSPIPLVAAGVTLSITGRWRLDAEAEEGPGGPS